MPSNKILFVEDEASLALIVKDSLESEGFLVNQVSDGPTAIKAFFEVQPDLVILDIMLPRLNGIEVAKTIRNTDRETPIIFLTAKSQVKDVVKGFEAGGNDYLRKPFSVEELIIRMKVMLSNNRLLDHVDTENQSHFQLGIYQFDSHQQILSTSQNERPLTARESELLKLFCENPNRLVTKKSILMKVWGDDSFFNSRSMDVFISRLRKYLQLDPQVKIINIRGSGYKLLLPS